MNQREIAWGEGRCAKRDGLTFKNNGNPCPYTYNNFPGMTVQEFNAAKRELMDAWFEGYLGKELRAVPTRVR